MSKFQTFYPGNLTEREKAGMKIFLAEAKALEERGPIDVKALISGTLPEGTPGVSNKMLVKEDMMLYDAYKYDPENKLYTDDEYAKAHGYKGKIAMPAFAAHDDSILTAFPREARDMMCVCSLSHWVRQLAPIYAGDTVYIVKDSINCTDITPEEGGEYRNLVIQCFGSVYNQDGVKVSEVMFGATENLKSWKEGEKDPSVAAWESPDWWKRAQHVYTDEDWEYIKGLWKNEYRRGDEPLYWEDVQVGDLPTWTCEGPIESTADPTPPYGMGVGGSRTMKKELLDPELSKKFHKDEATGIYFPEDKTWLTPEPPEYDDPRKKMAPPMPMPLPEGESPMPQHMGEGGMPPMPEGGDAPAPMPMPGPAKEAKRGIFINFAGRDFAIRHINNWMGDYGWLKEIQWGIMTDLTDFGYSFPMNPEAPYFIKEAPSMAGKHINGHGLQHDIMIIKSEVIKKYVKNGEYLAELIFWMETIDGCVYEHGKAIVSLPSKNA